MIVALDRETAIAATDRLKVFSQPQRLLILAALVECELSVGAIDTATGVGQPALSQQLAELRRAGLVAQKRVAKQVLYRLPDDRTTSVVRFLVSVFGHETEPSAAFESFDKPPVLPVAFQSSAAMFAVVDRD